MPSDVKPESHPPHGQKFGSLPEARGALSGIGANRMHRAAGEAHPVFGVKSTHFYSHPEHGIFTITQGTDGSSSVSHHGRSGSVTKMDIQKSHDEILQKMWEEIKDIEKGDK